MNTMIIKSGTELTAHEINQMNASLRREFKGAELKTEDVKNTLFFLLKEDDEILAMGGLLKVEPVVFDGKKFTTFGIVEVIANKKGIGYGSQVVTAMKDHLIKNDLTGIGFCMPKVQEFYEKCGFTVDTTSTHRFVYIKDGERITNTDGQYIFYIDSSDKFMEQVLATKDKEVSIPTKNLW